MCRVAGLSDDCHVAALAEWIAANRIPEERRCRVTVAAGRLPIDARFRAYRATG